MYLYTIPRKGSGTWTWIGRETAARLRLTDAVNTPGIVYAALIRPQLQTMPQAVTVYEWDPYANKRGA